MMQAIEEEVRSLRRKVLHWLERFGRHRGSESEPIASPRLVCNREAPNDAVSRILDRTAADLRELSINDSDDVDARPIIDRAVNELSKLGFQSRPFEEATMERYLRELPDRDYQILRYFKLGKRHSEIAAIMDTSIDAVRDSLVKTYADLRIRMIASGDDGGGGGAPASQVPYSNTFLKQTSLHRN